MADWKRPVEPFLAFSYHQRRVRGWRGGGGVGGGASRKCSEQDRAEGDSRHSQLNWDNWSRGGMSRGEGGHGEEGQGEQEGGE